MPLRFHEYLGAEEQNLLASVLNFRTELDLFGQLDDIFQSPIARLRIPEEDEAGLLVGQLYLFVHFHLYFSVSCLLRSHLSESFSSTRKAIDASLTAYKIILEPETASRYIQRDRYFQFIKASLQNEIKKNSSKYPLAHILIKLHDSCSEYGSHADISSFVHRIEMNELPGANADLLQVHYFQFPRDSTEYKFYFVLTLQAFLQAFRIFKAFFNKRLKIIDPGWEASIGKLNALLEQLRQQHYAAIDASQKAADS